MEEIDVKHFYWFAYYNADSPSVRYRAQFPLTYFQDEKGVTHDLIIPGYHPKKVWKFIRIFLALLFARKKDSLIVIQRVNSNFVFANLLKVLVKIHRKNTVYDVDDADYLEVESKSLLYFVKNCQFISAGSREIVSYLSDFNPNVFHITSPTVDLNIVKQKRNELMNIGWIGGFGGAHKESLIQLVFPILNELPFNIRLTILGVFDDESEQFIRDYFEGSTVQLDLPRDINWHDEKQIQLRIKSFDVGIATLTDTPSQRSKSGIKAKQYLNNGVPVLCNRLPENDALIEEGVNGFYCDCPEEFKKRIIDLKELSNEDYARLSKAARSTIEQFNHENYWQDFLKMYRSASLETSGLEKVKKTEFQS